jgi:hypothetical protein
MCMYCAHPRPCEKAGPQACFAAELYFLLQASPTVLYRISACFSDLVELSSLLPTRRHREEGDTSSRTRGIMSLCTRGIMSLCPAAAAVWPPLWGWNVRRRTFSV